MEGRRGGALSALVTFVRPVLGKGLMNIDYKNDRVRKQQMIAKGGWAHFSISVSSHTYTYSAVGWGDEGGKETERGRRGGDGEQERH